MIRPGEEWGSPAESPADLEVRGGDAALGQAVAAAPGALIRFIPASGSDLARAVGLALGEVREALGTALPLDALALGNSTLACNMCIFGTTPDRLRWSSPALELEIDLDGRPWFAGRASTVVVAIGQFLRGLDVVPRGHPGDGKAEIQVYELERRERRSMRARLATGSHVPHPRIHQRSARAIRLRATPPPPCEVDGVARPEVTTPTTIKVVPGAYRLLL
jgi:diacylglycerol kinase family enzyme